MPRSKVQLISDGDANTLPLGLLKNQSAIDKRRLEKVNICGLMVGVGMPCEKVYQRNCDLRRHEQTHLQKEHRPWKCDRCSHRTVQKQQLEQHKRTMHETTEGEECLCGRKWKDPSVMYKHLREMKTRGESGHEWARHLGEPGGPQKPKERAAKRAAERDAKKRDAEGSRTDGAVPKVDSLVEPCKANSEQPTAHNLTISAPMSNEMAVVNGQDYQYQSPTWIGFQHHEQFTIDPSQSWFTPSDQYPANVHPNEVSFFM